MSCPAPSQHTRSPVRRRRWPVSAPASRARISQSRRTRGPVAKRDPQLAPACSRHHGRCPGSVVRPSAAGRHLRTPSLLQGRVGPGAGDQRGRHREPGEVRSIRCERGRSPPDSHRMLALIFSIASGGPPSAGPTNVGRRPCPRSGLSRPRERHGRAGPSDRGRRAQHHRRHSGMSRSASERAAGCVADSTTRTIVCAR